MRDLKYEKDNFIYDEWRKEKGIKCKNYEICQATFPEWWFDCKGRYLCTNCHIAGFDNLTISDIVGCPICFEERKGTTYPNCEHTVCIECFKRCFYGDSDDNDSISSDLLEKKYENEASLRKCPICRKSAIYSW